MPERARLLGRISDDFVCDAHRLSLAPFSGGPPFYSRMNSVSLESIVVGAENAPSLVILHGLLGSSRNWSTILKSLAEKYRCHAVDLRNHGRSPHADSMAYDLQANDIEDYMDRHDIDRGVIVGHSMGGKVAMTLACRRPERVSGLVVVDIAPKPYSPRWEREFEAMLAVPVDRIKTRAEAESALEPEIKDWAFRKFLLTNLARRPEGGFKWTVNLPLLQSCLPNLFEHPLPDEARYAGPTLFLRGEHSGFVLDEDLRLIQRHFPQGRLETIADAGHNVHFDQPAAFVEALQSLLRV